MNSVQIVTTKDMHASQKKYSNTFLTNKLTYLLTYIHSYIEKTYNLTIPQNHILLFFAWFQKILRSLRLVNQVREEDGELIALHGLGWWIVVVVVSGIVFVPVITGLHSIEVPAAFVHKKRAINAITKTQ